MMMQPGDTIGFREDDGTIIYGTVSGYAGSAGVHVEWNDGKRTRLPHNSPGVCSINGESVDLRLA